MALTGEWRDAVEAVLRAGNLDRGAVERAAEEACRRGMGTEEFRGLGTLAANALRGQDDAVRVVEALEAQEEGPVAKGKLWRER